MYALEAHNGKLYAGGIFTTAGGNPANYIAVWDGFSWAAVGGGMNNPVNTLLSNGGNVYAGGWFTQAGGNSANYIANWNGSNWSPLGNGMNNAVSALVVHNSQLYAGGKFTQADGNPTNYIAKRDLMTDIEQNKNEKAEALIYPNPSMDFFNLEIDSKEAGKISADLFSPDGKLIQHCFEKNFPAGRLVEKVSLEKNISTGMYFLRIFSEENATLKKIIIR